MADANDPVVLVVEDEPDVADTYQLWLDADYDVRVAEDGSAALEAVDETVDVVLLDRMMPEMSGDEVLATIRERGLDCRVAMVSAVDPDFDILEMGFDDYVTKPPDGERLREVVAELVEWGELAEDVRQYRSLVSKRAALEAEKTDAQLAGSDEYEALVERIAATEADLDADADRFLDDAEFVGAIRELAGEEEPDEHDADAGEGP